VEAAAALNVPVVDDLLQAARWIIEGERQTTSGAQKL
jgi:hypothetical protein